MGRQEIQLAGVLLTGLFVMCLLFLERNWRQGVSNALWIPVIWMVILGSRPVSMWFGSEAGVGAARADLEGSPVDAFVFLLLILAAAFVLSRRQIDWHGILHENKWLFVFFLYLGISVLWSDVPDVAIKRWVKDVGSILMVLVILTEDEPVQAVKTALFRCSSLLIPTSVLLVKMFPYIGTSYDPWDGHPYFSGVTTNKNMLGMTLFVCGLSLAWGMFDLRHEDTGKIDKTRLLVHLLLGLMTAYLLAKAQSATAIGCSILGLCIILGIRLAIRWRVKRLGMYGFALALLFFLLYITFDVDKALMGAMGRDTTFTGRTDIWRSVLNEDINPLIGAGHASFWLNADRVDRISQELGLYFKLNEAHNGYLEVYLNSGLIGLFLLILVLIVGAVKIKREAVAGSTYAAFRLALLIGTAAYGMTEAVFRLSIIFSALLLVLMEGSFEIESLDETEEVEHYSAVAT